MKKQQYLELVEKAVAKGRANFDEATKKWREKFDVDYMFGYNSPGHIPPQLHMEGLLYSITKEDEYLENIRKLLLMPMELGKIFPEEIRLQRVDYQRGVPLLEPLFQLHAYINAYVAVKDTGVLSDEEHWTAKESIIRSVSGLTYNPEWGAHNRSMLRACAMVQAAAVLDETEETREWVKLADCLAEESIGRWSIEDAAHYIPLWMFACIMYSKWRGIEDEYYKKPQTKYYFDYITRIITPEGQLPGFGDAWFHSHWQIWVPILEKGAAVYNCGKMKAAAEKMLEFGLRKHKGELSPGLCNYMAYAYKWSSDEVEPESIDFGSGEVLDEVIGKKIIFRANGSYMLYNYCDEGGFAYIPRQYLRTSIPVKAEKMHHGHGDENSVAHLEKDGNVLLHESGYREKLPNGKYRSGLYHNKLVFREGLKDTSKGNYNALHDDGYYKHVDTEKLHFQSYPEVDYLRTRNHYLPLGLTWDRNVTWLKEEDVYIVLDWFETGRDCEITTGNLWHTQNAVKVADGVYETFIDTIQRGTTDMDPFVNKKDLSLLIEFMSGDNDNFAEAIRRNHGEATMVSETKKVSYKKGDREIFITVLTPHGRTDDPSKLGGKLRIEGVFEYKDGMSLVYDNRVYLSYKLNLGYALHPYEEDRAPAYDWETGKINYGRMTTDADFAYISDRGGTYSFGAFNFCRLLFDGRTIHETPRYTTRDFMVEKFKEIDHKWRSWNGTVEK